MRKRYLFLSMLAVFFLAASTHEASADRFFNILDSVKGGGGAKAGAAVSIVRRSNGIMFHDSTAVEKSNWIDVTDQFRQAGKIKKAASGQSSNDSLSKKNRARN